MPHDQPAVLERDAGLLAANPWVTRRRLTVAECHRMGEATPRPEDVLLMIEVADSSLAYDRKVEGALHARHGVPEFRLVDLRAGRIEVCRAPTRDGCAEVATVGRGRTIALALLPGVAIAATSVLG